MADDEPRPDGESLLLAAEYVLGVLNLEQRLEVERMIREDRAFEDLVGQWQERLAPLAENIAAVEPPVRVRAAIEARLFGPEPDIQRSAGWFDSVRVWRFAAISAAALFLLSSGIGLWERYSPEPLPAQLIIAMEATDAAPGGTAAGARFLALFEPDAGSIRVNPVAGTAESGKDFELWLVPGEDAPISLGILSSDGISRLDLSPELARRFAAGATLAVSVEPKGGSPTGTPTGPVIAAGSAKPI